jgi:drug/metabolite transporter (DMT)-like permease
LLRKTALLFALPALIWGSTWYVIKFQIGVTDSLVSVGLRFALASTLLFLYIAFRRLPCRFHWRQHVFMVLQGTCLFGLNYWLIYLAEAHLTSGLVAVIFSQIVFANILLSFILLKAPLKPAVVFGALMGFAGIILIFNREIRILNFSDKNFISMLLAFASVLFASMGNILSARNQKHRMPIVQTNAFGMLYGSVAVLMLALLTGSSWVIDTRPQYIFSLLYLALFGSVIAFGAYLTVLGRIGPDRSGYFALVTPPIALLLSTFFEDYRWTWQAIMGVLLILAGMSLALRHKLKRRNQMPSSI